MTVELVCVKENNKLRIRITAYISDETGVRHEHVYNNALNCRFSRNLRIEGRTYHVPNCNVKLSGGNNKAHFYSVSDHNIVIVKNVPEALPRVYEISSECVICMNRPSSTVFFPCGHFCSCSQCCDSLTKCCICRASIRSKFPY